VNEDIEKWLNEGLAEAVAGIQSVPPVAKQAPPALPQPTVKGKSSHGGVVRKTTTRVLSGQLNNPVANPKTSDRAAQPVKTVANPTPAEELSAENPALAIPTIMTGMDHGPHVNGRPNSNAFVESTPNPRPEVMEAPLSWATTMKDLFDRAVRRGGLYHVGNSMFVLSIQRLKPRELTVPEH
jgi:hypothetical protein